MFRISPKSLYQVNPVQTEILYQTAIDYAGLTGKETVIDAYCGIGTIGLIASEKAKEVISVELNPDAVKDAIVNAKRNGIKNVRFYRNEAGVFMRQMADEGESADVVFMDPPRSGSDEKFLSSVVTLNPIRVVYVSCNPATLARDLKYLTRHGYQAVKIQPVDSAHSAIFQSLNGEPAGRIEKILLTASGGPFRGRTREQLQKIQVEDALKHPNWSMGRKITIDSSTLVNKGLEVMEVKWLFGVDLDQIQVIVHPQSIIHSAVQYVDGAVIAQLGTPDMKLPIQYALFYPDRRPMPGKRLDFYELAQITFEKPDMETFFGLKLAYDAQRIGGSMPTVYNAANEKAVGLFLDRKIAYLQIPELIREAMEQHKVIENPNVEEILETEASVYSYIDGKGF